ncbi:MAG: glycosyltransferase family 39 protein [Patescibacteria group bacterium]|nr:glycosyltransferase family 39 protein [Patescibacteria group bacterium]
MFKNKLTYIFLGLIFILALFLRINRLSEFPVGFHIDEASLGYNAYSLLLTGKDENNNKLPLYIDMFGDERPSGYHYLDTIPVKYLGLSEFSTRLPGALAGALTIFAIFLFVFSIFKNEKLSFLSSLLLAISPWHVALSRASSEPVVALFFIILGFALVFLSLDNKKIKYLIIGSLFLSISFFFYHTPRVFVPLFYLSIVAYVLFFLKEENARFKSYLIGSFLTVCLIAMALVFFVTGGSGRFKQVSIFGFPETKLVMNEQIREDGVSGIGVLPSRFFHNKIVNYSLTFVSNYFQYFDGEFLFIKGGLPVWYKVPSIGLIYLIEAPFLLLGAIYLFTDKKNSHKLVLLWVLIAPVTASLTVDDIPNINRVIVLFPALEIISAFGFLALISKMPVKLFKLFVPLVAILLLFNVAYFLHQYFIHAPIHRNWYRDEGVGEMVKTIRKSYDGVDKVIVTKSGGIYPLILFYMKYDPGIYQKEYSPKDKDFAGFGKFFFVPQACPSQQKDSRFPIVKKTIYVDKGECENRGQRSKIIYRKDGTRVFNIVYE